MQFDVIILGGGASGLAACAALADTGLRIALVERLDRVGKKLLATGNGRCNLSNIDMRPALYHEAAPFVAKVYAKTPPQDILAFFESLGLMTATEDGRIYPRTMAASSVLDVLRTAIETRENITCLTGEQILAITPSRRGGWSVQLASGEGLFAPQVVCAMGGSAAPQMGTDGSAAQLLEPLGHSVTPVFPALVQLKCDHRALKSLKGVRVQAALHLLIDGAVTAQETGELLFTDYGVSGVCVFQLSRFAAKALSEKKAVALSIHLLPEIPPKSLPAWLDRRLAAHPNLPMQSFFTGVFHRLLAQAILREASIAPETLAASLGKEDRAALVRAISAFSLPVIGTQGFTQAQVTRGGIALDDVDPKTLSSRLYDGLYILGETLDVDGPCGGYNLHFAFACGLTAAKAIQSQLGV